MYDERRWHPGHWIRLGFLVIFAVFVVAMIYYMFTYAPGVAGTGPFVYWFPFGWIWIFFGFFLFFGLLRFAFWGPRWGYYRHYGYGYGRENEAYHILRERYARGEITKDQYDAMMRDLYQQAQNPPPNPPRY
ncbi:MAG TPA: SHOCT domain-containing protein [Thermoplasmata archaeon]|nr:SHOCT domain-containing protein [Thermoplasmata archaeon]